MTRAIDDKTSTCGSCSYWEHHADADGIHATPLGHCNWISVPAWVNRQLKRWPPSTAMRADEGLDCWLHTKRDSSPSQGGGK